LNIMEIFVARQPIFDKRNKVFGYELLYRSSLTNSYHHNNGDQATISVIMNSFAVIGMDVLTGGSKAFINFTKNLLGSNIASVLPPELVVIEVLEDVEVSPEVIAACKRLKQRGFLLALDDFVLKNDLKPLIEFADIIKVDFMKTASSERRVLLREIASDQVKFLAEKVETMADYQEALRLGYKYFQGYFFSRPMVMSGRDIPDYKLTYLRIMQEINRPEFDFEQLENIIKHNVSISYKLLRLINSVFFGLHSQVNSIRNALVLLGVKEIKKWVTLIALRGMAEDKPNELVITALIRAHLCEALADKVGIADRKPDLFLLGMFSLIDALLDRSMEESLRGIPVAEEIRGALLGEANNLRKVLDLVIFYEKGDWDQFNAHCRDLGLISEEFPELYLASLGMVRKVLG
jgi:c-di-GMP-related signal transduction protein